MIAKRHTWQLQEAKNKLSEVVRRAADEGPQTITVHGREAVVVLSKEAYDRLCSTAPNRALQESLLSFFQRSPLWESELNLERRDETYVPRVTFDTDAER